MLTKEPEMLQPDTFCEHTMQQNATAYGASPRTLLGELPPDPLSGFKGALYDGEGENEGREGEGRG